MTKSNDSLENELHDWLTSHERVVIAGIGNPIRMDDFVGVKIIKDLHGKLPKNINLIECETVPESFMDEIAEFKPSHVLLIDAAVMRMKPGEARLFDAEKVTNFPAISTHMLPLRVFCEYIKKMSGAKIALLLIEPDKTDFGEGLTSKVQKTANKVSSSLVRLLGSK